MPQPVKIVPPPITLTDWVASIGASVAGAINYSLELVGFLGLFLARPLRSLRHPKEFRMTALIHPREEVGFKAVPIVELMAFLTGVILAFQGSAQLKQFGAGVFVVDLIAISTLS
jgi:phospholipid/cholesterol/gamma-HCH transport system permease protein